MSKKNFPKKSIKNYQKLNNKLSGNGPTDRQTDRQTDLGIEAPSRSLKTEIPKCQNYPEGVKCPEFERYGCGQCSMLSQVQTPHFEGFVKHCLNSLSFSFV